MKYYSPSGNLEVWDKKPDGYMTEEEWQEAHPAPPPPEPTVEEKITMLDNDYNQQKAILSEQYTSALMADDAELADDVKAELAALNEWYDEEYAKIVGEE